MSEEPPLPTPSPSCGPSLSGTPPVPSSPLIPLQSSSNLSPVILRRPLNANLGRVHLLRVIQGLLVANHTTQTGSLESLRQFCFDDGRVAETIQLSHEGRRVMQRTDKRWGTAVSSTPLTDSERIHRWKVMHFLRLLGCAARIFLPVACANPTLCVFSQC